MTVALKKIWEVPPEWKGERCFILGGGPSLAEIDVASLRGRGRVIVINNAYKLAPWADALYFADMRWLEWHKDLLYKFGGEYIVTRAPVLPTNMFGIKRLRVVFNVPLSTQPHAVAGFDGGSNALNMAYLFGATEIVLCGFDMKGGNWHSGHPAERRDNCFEKDYIPGITAMAAELAKLNINVINTSLDSALTCFKKEAIDDYLLRCAQ